MVNTYKLHDFWGFFWLSARPIDFWWGCEKFGALDFGTKSGLLFCWVFCGSDLAYKFVWGSLVGGDFWEGLLGVFWEEDEGIVFLLFVIGCGFIVVLLLFYCCFIVVLLLFYCCFIVVLLLFYCCDCCLLLLVIVLQYGPVGDIEAAFGDGDDYPGGIP